VTRVGAKVAVDLLVLLAFAFGAGMVAFFSPCCAVMLPAYVSFTLGHHEGGAPPAAAKIGSRGRRELGAIAVWGGLLVAGLGLGRLALEAFGALGSGSPEDRGLSVALAAVGIAVTLAGFAATADRRALRAGLAFGGLATLGLLTVFLAIGLPIAWTSPGLTSSLGWFAVGVGVALIAVGALTLLGKRIPIRIPAFSPERRGPVGFFLYGAAYGLASLACTFPIFLSVITLAAIVGGGAGALAIAAYALGKGSLMILVTVLSIASPAAVEGRLRKIMPKFDHAMAAVTVLAGVFIVYYFGVLYAPV
jgi:cytochrome c-type biogenesis protein